MQIMVHKLRQINTEFILLNMIIVNISGDINLIHNMAYKMF